MNRQLNMDTDTPCGAPTHMRGKGRRCGGFHFGTSAEQMSEDKLRAVLMMRFDGDTEKVEKVIARRKAGGKRGRQHLRNQAGRWASMDEDKLRAILNIRFNGNEEKVNKIVARCMSGAQPHPRHGGRGMFHKGFWASASDEQVQQMLAIRLDGDQEKIGRALSRRAAMKARRAAAAAEAAAAAPTAEARAGPADNCELDRFKQMLLIRFNGDEEKVNQTLLLRKQWNPRMVARHCFGPGNRDAVPVTDDQVRQMLMIKFDGDIEKVEQFMSRRAARICRRTREDEAPTTTFTAPCAMQ